MQPYVAVTDKAWFDFLAGKAVAGRVDEVNFWSPMAQTCLKNFGPGEPVFFRLKSPWNAIVGYGSFAHHALFTLDECWRTFDWRNGTAQEAGFLQRIGGFRGLDLFDPRTPLTPLWCTVLLDARFWPTDRWIPWGKAQGWAPNNTRGAGVRGPEHAQLLLQTVQGDAAWSAVAEELGGSYHVVLDDERLRRLAHTVVREGQGAFRARLLDAYGGACAITEEHTEPVLDAAHIQPYLGRQSNNLQNGLVLTKEFHTLFDAGLVAITPEYRVRVSPALRQRWQNGKRYYEYDGKLLNLPEEAALRPSQEALAWRMTLFVA